MCIRPDPLPIAVTGFTTVSGGEPDPLDAIADLLPGVGLPCEAGRVVRARDTGTPPGLRPE